MEDNWFHFLVALSTVLLAGIGAMVLVLHNMTWKKLDRITALFMHAEDEVKRKLDLHDKELGYLQQRITVVETEIKGNHK